MLRKINFLKNTLFHNFSNINKVACKPIFISLQVSETCCLRCKQCDIWKNIKVSNRLNLTQQKIIIKELKSWLNGFKINFTGGEPFLNSDIFELIKLCDKLGLETFINSNGYLINENLAKKIVNSGLTYLSISLDSSKPWMHDYLRGKKGTYHRAIQSIKLINKFRKTKLPILNFTTIIMQNNIEDLEKMVYLAQKLQLDGVNFQPLMSKHNFGSEHYNSHWYFDNPLWPTNLTLVKKVLDKLIILKSKGMPIYNPIWELNSFKNYFQNPNTVDNPCLVGVSNFAIDIKGNVRLCYSMKPIGNLVKSSPREIWSSVLASLRRVQIKKCNKNCRYLLCNRKYKLIQIFNELFWRKFIKKKY